MVGDILPEQPGLEAWAVTGDGPVDGRRQPRWATTIPGTNQSIRWAADMTTQIVNGAAATVVETPTHRRLAARHAAHRRRARWPTTAPRATRALVADIFGDWREELLVRTVDSTAIRIYLSTELTTHKLYTLMHDPQYRVEVARQQTTYNQPSYPSFYFGLGHRLGPRAGAPFPDTVAESPGRAGTSPSPGFVTVPHRMAGMRLGIVIALLASGGLHHRPHLSRLEPHDCGCC